MATLTTTQTSPSLLGGVVIIGGTIIGAGMFSLPVVMSGAWFFWSMAALIFTWFCMLHSGLMILEANLNYRIGSSFDTITKDSAGQRLERCERHLDCFRSLYPYLCVYLGEWFDPASHLLGDVAERSGACGGSWFCAAGGVRGVVKHQSG